MTPLQNDILDGLAGETYIRQFALSRNTSPTTSEWVGGPGWGAEFGIVNPDNPNEIYAVATIANNKAAWGADGILWIVFPQAETALWRWNTASWYLDLIAPNTLVDPHGLRDNVLRGFLRCSPRPPQRNQPYPTTFV
jgi:hypothetical protein